MEEILMGLLEVLKEIESILSFLPILISISTVAIIISIYISNHMRK